MMFSLDTQGHKTFCMDEKEYLTLLSIMQSSILQKLNTTHVIQINTSKKSFWPLQALQKAPHASEQLK